MIEIGELATSVKEKKSKSEIHLLGRCWEWKSTSLIAFIFSVLVIVGKNVVRLQCRFKSWCKSRDIDCGYDVILPKMFARVKDTVIHYAFCFWRFALLFLVPATHYYTVSLNWILKNVLRKVITMLHPTMAMQFQPMCIL